MNFITPLICELLTYLDDCLFSFSPVCLSNSQDAHSYLIGISFASFFVCCTILSHTNGALTKTHSETLSYSLSLSLTLSLLLSLSLILSFSYSLILSLSHTLLSLLHPYLGSQQANKKLAHFFSQSAPGLKMEFKVIKPSREN